MQNLKLVCLMALTVLFLFLGGCQKEAEDSRVKQVKLSSNGLSANKIYSYSPVFNPRVESFVGKGRSVLTGFSSPDSETIKHVLKQIELQDSIHPFLYQLYNNNYSFDINYAILANKHDLGFEVHIPIFSANTLKGLLIYKEVDDKWWIKIITYKEIQDLLQNQNISDEKIVQYYPFIVSFIAINYRKFQFASKELDDWLSINFRKLNLTSGGSRLCYAVGYWIEYGYIWVGPNGACGGLCVAQYVSYQVCTDPELEPPCCGDGSIPGGNYGDPGSNSGWGSVNSSDINEIIKLFPELADRDCLEKYANSESLRYLSNLASDNVNNICVKAKIAHSFNDLCNTARENTPLENGNGNWVDLIDNNGNIFGTAFGGGTSGQFGPQDIGLSYKEIEDEINRLKRELIDPCTGVPLDIDYNKIKEALCNRNKLNLDDFKNEVDGTLDGNDYVDEGGIADQGGLDDKICPCAYEIWKQMKSKVITSGVNENVCINDILGDFLEGPLQVEIGISQNPLGDVNAKTLPNTTLGGNLLLFNTRIEIDKDICNGSKKKDAIEIAGTFLHEFVHARIFEHLYHLNYTTNLFVPSDVWKNFVQSHYPGLPITESHHQIMAQAFVNDIASALHELNGGVGNPSDYLIFAWQGLENAFTNEQKANFKFIPDFELLRNNYNQNVKDKGSLAKYNCK